MASAKMLMKEVASKSGTWKLEAAAAAAQRNAVRGDLFDTIMLRG